MEPDQLRAAAERWIQDDPDYETQQELKRLLESDDPSSTDLPDRFAGTLEFGTAGLRGIIGAGPNRMNRAVVIRATFGLCDVLLEDFEDDARMRGVVIGYDGRKMSREFAEDAMGVLAARAVRVHLFTTCGPTPLVAFATKKLGAVAGIMVTASHNPPEYNGYKVYWANGAQIIPPIDGRIAERIAKAPPAKAIERFDVHDVREDKLISDLSVGIERAYLDAVRALSVTEGGIRSLKIVYTPLHGVGNRMARAAFAEAGFGYVTTVPEQADPDSHFPTVAFPNPEEKGAMDLSFALGKKEKADLVIANDPDADRLAVAVPDESSKTGFRQLTGNQVGVLLGHHLLTEGPHDGKRLVLASIVSSPMLGVIAKSMGVRYEETLTGFKWIANRAMELEHTDGLRFVFGFEEALGYTVGSLVRDKDGISAAVAFAELAGLLREKGKTVIDRLEELYRAHGLFVSSQYNVTRKGAEGAAELRAMMQRLREKPIPTIGDSRVVAIADFEARVRTVLGNGGPAPLSLPKTNMIAFELEGGSRIIARPSGTEPKAKFYFDVRESIKEGEPIADAQARAQEKAKKLEAAFVKIAGAT
jgi:phosphomannomutase